MQIQDTLDPWIGARIDDYVIERELGRGGMAVVYKARDVVLGRPVALKILPQADLSNAEMIARFEREARVVARVNHPNLAQVYRIGTANGSPYYAMEFIDGASLSQILREKGKLGGIQTTDYMIQACKGLRAAAEHGIVHRDIKPANLMITRDGLLKIVDFGIAKVHQDDTFQTRTGTIIGTPRYMSPEQGRGLQIDHRSDIYSLGATCYHLLAGRPPFDSDNPVTLMLQHLQEPVRSITECNDRVPYRLCNIIYGMMAKNPADRIGDYTTLIDAFEKVYREQDATAEATALSAPAAPAAPAGTAPDERKLGLWKWMLAAAAFVLLLSIAGSFAFRGIRSGDLDPYASTPGEDAAASAPGSDADPTLNSTVETLRKIHDFRKELDQEAAENPGDGH